MGGISGGCGQHAQSILREFWVMMPLPSESVRRFAGKTHAFVLSGTAKNHHDAGRFYDDLRSAGHPWVWSVHIYAVNTRESPKGVIDRMCGD
jgi:hypothetical protein